LPSIPREHYNESRTENFKLDVINRRILALLQENARYSTSEISKKIGDISKVAVASRIRKMVASRVIEGFTTRINGNSVDQGYVIIVRVVCSVQGPEQRAIATKIATYPGVQTVYQIFGHYDIIATVKARDKEAARDLVFQIYSIGNVDSTDTEVVHTVIKESVDTNVLQGRN
jgi:Lrp/AsnC family leucine-responsive transcriptional regulator